ncbi:zinc-binding metallopeptidase family protein [Aquabacterium sp. A7-Y]|uniref:zinc-binding metallopeptidase family protein n=1 Tax=Aquabacterium sp. A7-Y TaxID=1349605 RepID=UPI0039FBBE4B
MFFRNSTCTACGTPLGFVASRVTLLPLEPAEDKDTWRALGDVATSVYRRCGNFLTPAGCNWLIEDDDSRPRSVLCVACRLNRTIPDLSRAENQRLWMRMEQAKRRLVSQLIGLGLPVRSKREDPSQGLAYDFLRSAPGRPPVMTGHRLGVITINIEEADDAVRERTREEMGEPYRTLLGHFRHEVGHYYWDRLVAGTPWHQPCREIFGDEREDYGAALTANYRNGPPADWRRCFVSAYASMHPWEDWAETWAHYLHMRDTIDTAVSFGIVARHLDVAAQPYGPSDLWDGGDPNGGAFLQLLHSWIDITGVMNEMSSAMGLQDFYPFVLPRRAVAKLHFIHRLVSQAGSLSTPSAVAGAELYGEQRRHT